MVRVDPLSWADTGIVVLLTINVVEVAGKPGNPAHAHAISARVARANTGPGRAARRRYVISILRSARRAQTVGSQSVRKCPLERSRRSPEAAGPAMGWGGSPRTPSDQDDQASRRFPTTGDPPGMTPASRSTSEGQQSRIGPRRRGAGGNRHGLPMLDLRSTLDCRP